MRRTGGSPKSTLVLIDRALLTEQIPLNNTAVIQPNPALLDYLDTLTIRDLEVAFLIDDYYYKGYLYLEDIQIPHQTPLEINPAYIHFSTFIESYYRQHLSSFKRAKSLWMHYDQKAVNDPKFIKLLENVFQTPASNIILLTHQSDLQQVASQSEIKAPSIRKTQPFKNLHLNTKCRGDTYNPIHLFIDCEVLIDNRLTNEHLIFKLHALKFISYFLSRINPTKIILYSAQKEKAKIASNYLSQFFPRDPTNFYYAQGNVTNPAAFLESHLFFLQIHVMSMHLFYLEEGTQAYEAGVKFSKEKSDFNISNTLLPAPQRYTFEPLSRPCFRSHEYNNTLDSDSGHSELSLLDSPKSTRKTMPMENDEGISTSPTLFKKTLNHKNQWDRELDQNEWVKLGLPSHRT